MDNNEYRNFEALDLLTLISFLAQIQNMNEDTKEKAYIHEVIKAISIEIEKLECLSMKVNYMKKSQYKGRSV